jgi:voltage-gated potassium channel
MIRDDAVRATWERRLDLPLTMLAVGFLAVYALPILDTHLPAKVRHGLALVTLAIWAVFALDYLIRLALAERRSSFVKRHLLDLAVIILPLLRPLRALRLITAISILNRNARGSLHGRVATYVVASVALLVFVASLAILDAERGKPASNIESFPDALWWSATTIATVGYGDRYPVTASGRLVAAGLMIAGIGLLGVVTATLASWFVEKVAEKGEQQQSTLTDLTNEVRKLRTEIAELRSATPGSPRAQENQT